jgi:hypothetical protein
MLTPLYIGEISAPESRGALLALDQLGIVRRIFPYDLLLFHLVIQVFGVVVGFWFGFLTRSCTLKNAPFCS